MDSRKTTMLVLGTAMVVSGPIANMAAPLTALADDAPASSQGIVLDGRMTTGDIVEVSNVQGEFSFDQGALTSNERIKSVFQKASQALCEKSPLYANVAAEDWNIEVSGDVRNAFTATIGDMQAQKEETKMVLTCACSNNIAGGAAIINAGVAGISLADIASMAAPSPTVNAVTLTAHDGTEMTFSLSYLMSHSAVIATEINGEGLEESVGGVNQLWMANSAGKYFVRDVVKIAFTSEEQSPVDPVFEATDFEYTNSPNVSAKIG